MGAGERGFKIYPNAIGLIWIGLSIFEGVQYVYIDYGDVRPVK